MIQNVLSVIVGELNGFLMRPSGSTEDKAVLTALVDAGGSYTHEGKVMATLYNLEQERTNINVNTMGAVRTNPPINVNLYLLFAVYSPNLYSEALKLISQVIGFFQGKQVFTNANTPGLPDSVDKITIEIQNLDLHQLTNLWSAVGAKVVPSVAIKFRMLSISREVILEDIPEITTVETTAEA